MVKVLLAWYNNIVPAFAEERDQNGLFPILFLSIRIDGKGIKQMKNARRVVEQERFSRS